MKRTALFITAALLASSPVFANEDLCTVNLQKIDDALAANNNIGDPLRDQVKELHMKAQQAQQNGDTEGCINASSMALQRLEQPSTNGSGGESS
ncbi:hypothetical protein [Metapseudomonas resinovorans]|uniref:Secreted protein n=1 Tax=Metapseudomonas resinovorans NBRC 106553 TaxID=1245471 RepID=S6B0D2_METRE|nr:hypothetical protein [Pseudomonas resinovorans]BAN50671.1 hypothetical protein PCA10_49390 [Pseudomonas resinovorans NBRC 106553]